MQIIDFLTTFKLILIKISKNYDEIFSIQLEVSMD